MFIRFRICRIQSCQPEGFFGLKIVSTGPEVKMTRENDGHATYLAAKIQQECSTSKRRNTSNNAWVGAIVVHLFPFQVQDLFTACFCEVQINAGGTVNLDVELL